MIYLTGPLASNGIMTALDLQGQAATLQGRLVGRGAGTGRADWPLLAAAQDRLPAVKVTGNARLDRYAAVMGLRVHDMSGQRIMGIAGQGASLDPLWEMDAEQEALAAEIARQILAAPSEATADHLAWRLPMIGAWAASRVRGRAMAPSGEGVVARRPRDAVFFLDQQQHFAGFFAVEESTLTHTLHGGGESAPLRREGFLMGDAVVLLPWDPVRDRLLVVEQFRFAPALRGDPQPWLLEAVAGRVDAGETVEEAIRREAREEADLALGRLFPAAHAYPSPGAVCEFLFHYVGVADLPPGSAGIHGLAGEAEDIRGHLLDRAQLSLLVRQGQITNAPLALLSLWLDLHHQRLRAELGVD